MSSTHKAAAIATTPCVLVIEDDRQIARFLRTTLQTENYRLIHAGTAAEGVKEASSRLPDVILLDLGLPDFDGLRVIAQIREWNSTVPIIVLSVRDREQDKIMALDAGADDFVSKPFAAGELLARIRAALRRATRLPDSHKGLPFRLGPIEVDLTRRRVLVGGVEKHLTRIEYKLLLVLIRHADCVVTHNQLLTEVWGPAHQQQSHYVRVYMALLRRKLEADPTRPRYLKTESGVGYRLNTEGGL